MINCKQHGWGWKLQVAQGCSQWGEEPFKLCMNLCALQLPNSTNTPFLFPGLAEVALKSMFLLLWIQSCFLIQPELF